MRPLTPGERESHPKGIVATADRLDYFAASDRADLFGNVEIIDRDNIMRGARAEVEFDEISRLLSTTWQTRHSVLNPEGEDVGGLRLHTGAVHQSSDEMNGDNGLQLRLGQQPTLVQSQSGLRANGIGKSFNKRRVVRNVSIELTVAKQSDCWGQTVLPHFICWLG